MCDITPGWRVSVSKETLRQPYALFKENSPFFKEKKDLLSFRQLSCLLLLLVLAFGLVKSRVRVSELFDVIWLL